MFNHDHASLEDSYKREWDQVQARAFVKAKNNTQSPAIGRLVENTVCDAASGNTGFDTFFETTRNSVSSLPSHSDDDAYLTGSSSSSDAPPVLVHVPASTSQRGARRENPTSFISPPAMSSSTSARVAPSGRMAVSKPGPSSVLPHVSGPIQPQGGFLSSFVSSLPTGTNPDD